MELEPTTPLEESVDRETIIKDIYPLMGVLDVMVENDDIVISTSGGPSTEGAIRRLISKTKWDIQYIAEIDTRHQIALSC